MRIRKNTAVPALAVGGALVLAAALGACGSSGHASSAPASTTPSGASAPTTTTPGGSSSGSSPTTTVPSAASSTTTATATAPAGTDTCPPDALAASLGEQNGAAGTESVTLVLRNVGSAPCTMFGYPGVALTNSSGNQVVEAQRGQVGTPIPERSVTVEPGAFVTSSLSGHDMADGGASCPRSAGMLVTPPNTRHSFRLAGWYECGTTVGPVEPLAPSGGGTGPVTALAPPNCTVSNLTVTARASAAGGQDLLTVDFRKQGAGYCLTTGFPGVAFLNAAGGQAIQAARVSPAPPDQPLVIGPTQPSLSALVADGAANPSNGAACPTYAGLLVTPPNDTRSVPLKLSFRMCSPTVSPIAP